MSLVQFQSMPQRPGVTLRVFDLYLKPMIKFIIHYFLHLVAPGIIAKIFFRNEWKKAWIIMLLTMLVDLDHLLSTPIFDPNRLSVGYHLLHSYPAIAVYVIMIFFKRTRIIGVGLSFHMLTDLIDYFIL